MPLVVMPPTQLAFRINARLTPSPRAEARFLTSKGVLIHELLHFSLYHLINRLHYYRSLGTPALRPTQFPGCQGATSFSPSRDLSEVTISCNQANFSRNGIIHNGTVRISSVDGRPITAIPSNASVAEKFRILWENRISLKGQSMSIMISASELAVTLSRQKEQFSAKISVPAGIMFEGRYQIRKQSGKFRLETPTDGGSPLTTRFDVIGKRIQMQDLTFNDAQQNIHYKVAPGTYLTDNSGSMWKVIRIPMTISNNTGLVIQGTIIQKNSLSLQNATISRDGHETQINSLKLRKQLTIPEQTKRPDLVLALATHGGTRLFNQAIRTPSLFERRFGIVPANITVTGGRALILPLGKPGF
jgi:hypothetical protein